MQEKILLVEDDLSISEMVETHLTKDGFKVTVACDGEQAVRLFADQTFDLILLDLMLPKLNGMDFLRIVRERSIVPVLIMSAKDTEVDKALGLGFGADDYLSKPFSMIELTARVKASLRRAAYYSQPGKEVKPKLVELGELSVDLDNFNVRKHGEDLKLTAKEFQILKLFVEQPKKTFTKAQIYRSVWEDDYYGDENVINVHMRRLREKIEDNPSAPRYIKTLWGIGYKLGEF